MLRFAVDENFNNVVIRGLRRRFPELDLVRVQDAGLSGADDPAVLAWAARENRIVLTHDISTVSRFAYVRVDTGEPMPGVFEIPRSLTASAAIEDLMLIAQCSQPDEWNGQGLVSAASLSISHRFLRPQSWCFSFAA
jgi:Domain of unknown function (DUF5615)